MRCLILLFSLLLFFEKGFAQPTLRLNSEVQKIDLIPFIKILNHDADTTDIKSVFKSDNFIPIKNAAIQFNAPVHWLKFKLLNELPTDQEYHLSVPFTDYISFFSSTNDELAFLMEKTGDKVPLTERSNPIGKMVFIKFTVPSGKEKTYFLKLESASPISQQFKPFALSTIKLYSEEGFEENFETVRLYQALFYGAILIMLFYNFFIYLSLRDKSYLYYVIFIFFLIVFLAADDGILAEIFFQQKPRWDLYIRFISTPLLIISFLLFSKSYLQCKTFLPQAETGIRILIGTLILIILIMVTGNWHLGRSMAIIGTVFCFLTIFTLAIRTVGKGYTPGRYFLYANLLLLVGGIIFALQRYMVVSQNPITQFSIQISATLQVALFSLGLADRINLTKKDLVNKTLENERLERQKEVELKQVIEEKNLELEHKVKVRTAEVIEQKEEIEVQNENLESYNVQLEQAKTLIEAQNKELSSVNNWLEAEVSDRTRKLKLTNEELQNSNKELDNFIYKTAHDIRGPLARLMGLCNVALLDVKDEKALQYFQMLDSNALELNTIILRLSTIYKISHHKIEYQEIFLKPLVIEIIEANKSHPNFKSIDFNILISDTLTLNSDPVLLKLMLENLINNSIKYIDCFKTEQSFITISERITEDVVELSVIDNGIGIKQEETRNLFEMFSPAADVHKTPGLGLYIVKISAAKLNGSISLIRENDELNTHFMLRLPSVSAFKHPLQRTQL